MPGAPDVSEHENESTHFKLGEISGKIDLVLVQLATDRQANEARFTRIEDAQASQAKDISTLKQHRSWIMGGLAAMGTAVSAGFSLLSLHK